MTNTGPNAAARKCEEVLARLIVERNAAANRKQRKMINQRIRQLRDLLDWCRSRAGYQ